MNPGNNNFNYNDDLSSMSPVYDTMSPVSENVLSQNNNEQNNSQVQPENNEEPPKKKKSKNEIIFYALIFLFLVTIVGFVVFTIQDKTKQNEEPTNINKIDNKVEIITDEAKFLELQKTLRGDGLDESPHTIVSLNMPNTIRPLLETSLVDFEKGFDNFSAYIKKYNNSSKYDNPYYFTFVNNSLTYRYLSGFSQTIDNVKDFNYEIVDEYNIKVYVLTNEGFVWSSSFDWRIENWKEVESPKFIKTNGTYESIKHVVYQKLKIGAVGDALLIDHYGKYYYLNEQKFDENLAYVYYYNINSDDNKKYTVPYMVDVNGDLSINYEKVGVKFKYRICEYSENDLYFIIDENNYLYYVSGYKLYKYPYKVISLEKRNTPKEYFSSVKVMFENKQEYEYDFDYGVYVK